MCNPGSRAGLIILVALCELFIGGPTKMSSMVSRSFGQNLGICSLRFKCSVERLLSCDTNNLVHRFVDNLIDINERRAARFLTELLLLREGRLQLGLIDEGGSLSRNELNEIVAHVCTAQPV